MALVWALIVIFLLSAEKRRPAHWAAEEKAPDHVPDSPGELPAVGMEPSRADVCAYWEQAGRCLGPTALAQHKGEVRIIETEG